MRQGMHTACPYFTMFPLDFPQRVLRRYARSKTWVLDPFCGRGTTNYAARLMGLASVGIDSSPVAVAIAAGKLPKVRSNDVIELARSVLQRQRDVDVPQGAFWKRAFHRQTLVDLCRLREHLLADCTSPEARVLRTILMGALHGPRPKGEPSYFSNQCPRTYAPKPDYAVRFWKARGLRPPHVDTLALIAKRAKWYLADQPDEVGGEIVLGDGRNGVLADREERFGVIITSPPYYGMRTYIPDQWLRHWFVGGPAHVDYRQPEGELSHASPGKFADQLRRVWQNVARVSTTDAILVVRLGAISDRHHDPLELLRASLRDSGWKLVTARRAGSAAAGKRQADQFKRAKAGPIEEWDGYARFDG